MSDPLATLEAAPHGDHGVALSVRGEVDSSNADALGDRMLAAAAGARRVVADLSAVEYLDSQGLRLLVDLAEHLAARGARLVIVAPGGGAAGEVLRLTGMDAVLDVVRSLPGPGP